MALVKGQESCEYVEPMFRFRAAPDVGRLKCGSLFAIRRDGNDIVSAWRE